MIDSYQGRLALQQRLLPIYRVPFFEALANACPAGLSVFAGDVSPSESIPVTQQLANARVYPAHNHHLGEIHSPFYLLWQGGLLNWLSSWDPAVLVIEANPRYVSTRRGMGWMHHRNRPVIGWGLGAAGNLSQGGVRGWVDRFQDRMRRNFLLSLDAIIAYSQRGAQEYQKQGIASERIFVAPNAVAPRPTQPPPQRAAAFQGRAKLLFVGRLQARKRIDNLFIACSALPEPIQPEITIVGDGPVRTELEAQAKTVYPRAHFTGDLRGANLAEQFRQADLFVLPGSGGLAVQEAMSYALPVIVAEGDGTQSDLVRPENGWQVKPGDRLVLQSAISTALADPAHLRQMGAASYRIVADEINLETMVATFIDAMTFAQSARTAKR